MLHKWQIQSHDVSKVLTEWHIVDDLHVHMASNCQDVKFPLEKSKRHSMRLYTFCPLRSYVSSPASGAVGAGLTPPQSGSSGSRAGHKLARPPTPDSARPADRIKVCRSACG